MHILTLRDVQESADRLGMLIYERYGRRQYHLIAIPRGGVPVAYILAEALRKRGCLVGMSLSSDHVRASADGEKTIAVDDILTTGRTMGRVLSSGEASSGAVLYTKDSSLMLNTLYAEVVTADVWIQFPWEQADEDLGKPEDAVRRLIEYLGDDPTRGGLRETPARVLRFLEEAKKQPAPDSVAAFETEVGDLIVTARIPFASLCEHHMLPYFGEASVGYIPHVTVQDGGGRLGGKLLGLSKAARAVQIAAGGLTLQEHLTRGAAVIVSEWAHSEDVAVLTTATHSCMVVRGVKAIGSRTLASAMLGKFRTSAPLRAEFFAVVREAKSLA